MSTRPAWVEVDLAAIRHNVGLLVELAAPAQVCAVVKADGYGHGAAAVAIAALEAGATWLAVALPEEGAALRAAGIDAPILLLSEPETWEDTVAAALVPTVYSETGIAGLAVLVGSGGAMVAEGALSAAGSPFGVHLKVDTGMHRVGVTPEAALDRARQVVDSGVLHLDAVWTHCPVADELEHPFTAGQADRFDAVLAELRAAGVEVPMAHAANSAATIAHPRLRHDLVRCGIAVYGLEPSAQLRDALPWRPALSWKARVSHVQDIAAGEAVSYGLRRPAPTDTRVATVPLGYADGVPRRLREVGGVVLIGGRRCELAGTVTMDQLLVDCGPGAEVRRGDEVVLIGRQGDDEITAAEWADRLGTITYEIVCGIGQRVPRVHLSA